VDCPGRDRTHVTDYVRLSGSTGFARVASPENQGIAPDVSGSEAHTTHVYEKMTYRGSLPSGQGYNGQQQLPPAAYNQLYGPGQNGQFAGGYVQVSGPQQPVQAMQYGANTMAMNGPAYLQSFGGSYHHQQFPQASMPPVQYAAQESFAHPAPASSNLYQQISFQPTQPPPQPVQYAQPAVGNVNGAVSSNYPPPEASRLTSSPQPTGSKSPALSTKSGRSPGISKKSSAISPKTKSFDNVGLLVSIAEECLRTAHGAARDIAKSPDESSVLEYQKLISTGLACLETALQSNKLSPRQEAKLRFRYASLLCDETENLMDAETTLTKGITLCDKHRYLDLKYCMQYLLLKVLFQRNQKAALKATDSHITDATALRHVHWIYAFRFLKATFHMQSTNPSDSAAIENLRTTAALATQRGDKALVVLAILLEALTLMKTMKTETTERVQSCIAQVSKFQLDPAVRIPQLDFLARLVDLACCMHQKNPDVLLQKLHLLEEHLKENLEQPNWKDSIAEIALPIRKPQSSATTISDETAAILRQGLPESTSDFLIMSFVTKTEIWSLWWVYD
jgi:Cohesin loading factor